VAIAVRAPAQVGPLHAPLIKGEDIPGPLGGLASGLRFAQEGRAFLLAIPADMPFLPLDLLDKLEQAIGSQGCAVAASGGHVHPVFVLWRSSSIDKAKLYADTARRSLIGFSAQLGTVAVELPTEPVDPFFNINTSEDLAEAARRSR
jgi:molybdopterin-guanine dinucleotide biosynthesis protein A